MAAVDVVCDDKGRADGGFSAKVGAAMGLRELFLRHVRSCVCGEMWGLCDSSDVLILVVTDGVRRLLRGRIVGSQSCSGGSARILLGVGCDSRKGLLAAGLRFIPVVMRTTGEMTVTHERGDHGNDSAGNPDSAAPGSGSRVAAQSKLGLCPERRVGPGSCHPADSAGDGAYLADGAHLTGFRRRLATG